MIAALPIVSAVSLALAAAAFAQNLPLADLGLLPGDGAIAPAVNSQQDHSAARGGNLTLVAWSDYRARSNGGQMVQTDGDIYGVRIDADGVPVERPFLIAGGMGLQQRPLVAWNGQSWLVVFLSQDPVGGYFADQLRAVRIGPTGAVVDTTPILFPPTQFEPSTIGLRVSGQGGQWLVTRCIYHSDGYGTFLAGQRISNAGVLLDTTPRMLIDWVYGQTVSVTAATSGEYLVAGPDWTDSAIIKARRVDLNGSPVGAQFNVPGTNIASNGSEYYVTWIANFTNLVGSRISPTGTLVTPAGTSIVPNFSQYNQSALVHDGSNWWFEWGAADQLNTIRIDAAGQVLDPNGGVRLPITIGGNINQAYGPTLVSRPGGGVQVLWYDLRTALGIDSNVFTMPVSAANVPGTERCASVSSANQRNPDFSAGPGDSMAIVFTSEHANNNRVLVHFLDRAGRATTTEPIEITRATSIGKAGIAWNGSAFMIAWDQGSDVAGPAGIRARRMNPDGTFVDAAPFPVMPGFNADVEALGSNFLVAGARVAVYPRNIFLVASRIDGATGSLLDGPNGLSLGGFYVNGLPRVRTDGSRWLVAAHSQWSHDSSQGDAILARVPATGTPSQASNPTPVSGGSGDLDIAFSGNKYLLVWRMNTLSNANNYIAGRIMNADGTFPPGTPGYFTIAEGPGRQLRPTVSWDGTTFVVAWDDQRNQAFFFDQRTDTYAVRISETGSILDATPIAIQRSPGGDVAASIFSRNGVTFFAEARIGGAEPSDTYRIGLNRIGTAPCTADVDNGTGTGTPDGAVGIEDLLHYLVLFESGSIRADVDDGSSTGRPDRGVGIEDLLYFIVRFSAGC
jgi:hypothetical protein